MSRKKISEYRAKSLILNALGEPYRGVSIDLSHYKKSQLLTVLDDTKKYVVKVDQAIKKRNQQNLVSLNLGSTEVAQALLRFKTEGYTWAIVEDFYPHAQKKELFFALQREERGVILSFSEKGGVNVEEHPEDVKTLIIEGRGVKLGFGKNLDAVFRSLLSVFEKAHMTYLEINPLLVNERGAVVLDAAVEVDTAAQFFVEGAWTESDFREPKTVKYEAEKAVDGLAATSPSSLTLKVLNKDGSIFLLLSGGGASVVVADEFANLGYHEAIGNYGEYSGNPTEEETYLYAKQVLKLLIDSNAKSKKLVIAGGVANFTDVAKTFKGVIRAIEDDKEELIRQGVQVFVRRGGPNQQAGLAQMKHFLNDIGIQNKVNGSELSLATIVHDAVKGLTSDKLTNPA